MLLRVDSRLEQKGFGVEWTDVIRDLDNLVEMEITVSDKCRREPAFAFSVFSSPNHKVLHLSYQDHL